MNTAFRFISIVALALILAACARDVRDEPSAPSAPSASDAQTGRINARDFSDARNLENPDSLLSQRVIYFEFDRSDVRAQFRPIIEAHAAYMRANPSARVSLESHADERGSREYNLGLGERRGGSVSSLLSAGGASSGQIEVVSYGEERPVCRDSNNACWERNRRVEIVYTAR